MKKKLLSLVVCSALLLSTSREMKAIDAALWAFLVIPVTIYYVIPLLAVSGLSYGTYALYKNNHPNAQKTVDESQELINNINETYGPLLAVENFDVHSEQFLEQLAHAKNPDYSVNKYIVDCAKNLKNLSWYQKKLRQHERQSKKKNTSIKRCDNIKHTLAEIEQLKPKMELLHKTFVDHRYYFLLQENLDSINSTSHKSSKNDVKNLQRLQAKINLNEYPALQEKVRTVPLVA